MKRITVSDAIFSKYPRVALKLKYPEDHSDIIEWAGRQSTGTEGKGKAEQFTKARVKEGHISLLRFAGAEFEVECSRSCSMQMLRHKFLDFCQLSQRFAIQQPEFIVPSNMPMVTESHYFHSCVDGYNDYLILLNNEIKKEDARYLLPESAFTSMAVVANFQAIRDFLALRLDKHAQWEIRTIAVIIGKIMLKVANNCFFDLTERILESEEELCNYYGTDKWLI
jgi:flavin-dependent thymidylate synthase